MEKTEMFTWTKDKFEVLSWLPYDSLIVSKQSTLRDAMEAFEEELLYAMHHKWEETTRIELFGNGELLRWETVSESGRKLFVPEPVWPCIKDLEIDPSSVVGAFLVKKHDEKKVITFVRMLIFDLKGGLTEISIENEAVVTAIEIDNLKVREDPVELSKRTLYSREMQNMKFNEAFEEFVGSKDNE